MPSPLPRLSSPVASLVWSGELRPSLNLSQVGSRIAHFEACSTFTNVTACVFAKSPKATLYTRGFGDFVTSITAPIATGWGDSCRVGFAPLKIGAFSRRTEIFGLRRGRVHDDHVEILERVCRRDIDKPKGPKAEREAARQAVFGKICGCGWTPRRTREQAAGYPHPRL